MINIIDYLKDRINGKAEKGQKRSSKWRKVRNNFIKKNPRCFVCNGNKKLIVHHIVPFNIAPHLELNEGNLITLCERKKYGINCHLLIGHLGNFRKFNSNFENDSYYWKMRLRK